MQQEQQLNFKTSVSMPFRETGSSNRERTSQIFYLLIRMSSDHHLLGTVLELLNPAFCRVLLDMFEESSHFVNFKMNDFSAENECQQLQELLLFSYYSLPLIVQSSTEGAWRTPQDPAGWLQKSALEKPALGFHEQILSVCHILQNNSLSQRSQCQITKGVSHVTFVFPRGMRGTG